MVKIYSVKLGNLIVQQHDGEHEQTPNGRVTLPKKKEKGAPPKKRERVKLFLDAQFSCIVLKKELKQQTDPIQATQNF